MKEFNVTLNTFEIHCIVNSIHDAIKKLESETNPDQEAIDALKDFGAKFYPSKLEAA